MCGTARLLLDYSIIYAICGEYYYIIHDSKECSTSHRVIRKSNFFKFELNHCAFVKLFLIYTIDEAARSLIRLYSRSDTSDKSFIFEIFQRNENNGNKTLFLVMSSTYNKSGKYRPTDFYIQFQTLYLQLAKRHNIRA
jgi:hypothetical protein